MARVINGDIWLTRGDTFERPVHIIVGGNEYTPTADDTVVFRLKRKDFTPFNQEFKDETALIEINIPVSTMVLVIPPSATEQLHFGDYYYDIRWTDANGKNKTFVHDKILHLTPKV